MVGRHENVSKSKTPNEETTQHFLSVAQVRGFRQFFSFLNGKDRDVLYLIFVARKKQKEVQNILQRSQPSLCYDIKRIRCRMRFIFYLCSVFDIFIEFVRENPTKFTAEEMDILILMFYSSSFTQTAEVLNISQVRVRYTFDKCIRRMEETKLWSIYEIFTSIRGNLNIIKRKYKGSTVALNEIFFPM
jgi:DNA-directed RNA polymerase specialized sigma subunit